MLRMPPPAAAQTGPTGAAFTGYGGVGDYAASNGDPWSVVAAGHQLAQGAYTPLPADIADTGESFDLLVVGGGLSGLGAAYYFAKATRREKALPDAGKPSHVRRPLQAERIPGRRPTADRSAGLQRFRHSARGFAEPRWTSCSASFTCRASTPTPPGMRAQAAALPARQLLAHGWHQRYPGGCGLLRFGRTAGRGTSSPTTWRARRFPSR